MSASSQTASTTVPARTNGSGAAAILSAGFGAFCIGVFAVAADKSPHIKALLNIYKPTGPLSGVTTAAIVLWLVSWAVLVLLWRKRDVRLAPITTLAFVLLGLSFLLTFPPFADLL
jgi:hypothetical protein